VVVESAWAAWKRERPFDGQSEGKELLGFEVEELNESLNLCALGEDESILYVDAR
jgi:hypothetical protein